MFYRRDSDYVFLMRLLSFPQVPGGFTLHSTGEPGASQRPVLPAMLGRLRCLNNVPECGNKEPPSKGIFGRNHIPQKSFTPARLFTFTIFWGLSNLAESHTVLIPAAMFGSN
jgi:hypothetical protein